VQQRSSVRLTRAAGRSAEASGWLPHAAAGRVVALTHYLAAVLVFAATSASADQTVR
jgi:hypothetical protein